MQLRLGGEWLCSRAIGRVGRRSVCLDRLLHLLVVESRLVNAGTRQIVRVDGLNERNGRRQHFLFGEEGEVVVGSCRSVTVSSVIDAGVFDWQSGRKRKRELAVRK